MRTRRLGPLDVSVVGLGCNNFGGRIDEAATRAVVDAALDSGITFFDTADVYGNRGRSEEILGRVLEGRRDRVVLATKFGKEMGDGATRRGSRDYVRRALDASLARLRTDVVDLYQHHEEDPDTPLEETFGVLDEFVAEGKIRAYGTSNYRPETLRRAKAIAGEGYVSEQSEYSWLERGAEDELLPTCEELGLGFIPYFPLASGLLTGKVSHDRPPAEGTRLHGRTIAESRLDRVERLRAWAEAHGVSLLDVAIGGLAAVPPVASVIAGATKPEQVRANARRRASGSRPRTSSPSCARSPELRPSARRGCRPGRAGPPRSSRRPSSAGRRQRRAPPRARRRALASRVRTPRARAGRAPDPASTSARAAPRRRRRGSTTRTRSPRSRTARIPAR
jgi:aryl-alcohol dehydrogenase-like predicted oxidoreductase